MTVSPAVDQTRAELVGVLGQHGLQLADTQTPVRLAESPLLTTAPRAVYQVVLPKDPDKGYIVVYEFSDPSLAAAAAAEQQGYLGSGPGRVQTPQGTISVIRQVGSTVVLYQWLPGRPRTRRRAGSRMRSRRSGSGSRSRTSREARSRFPRSGRRQRRSRLPATHAPGYA